MNTAVNFESEALVSLKSIQFLLEDPQISEILIDGYDNVYVERSGRQSGYFEDVPTPFQSNEQVMDLVSAILSMVGRTVDDSGPLIDTRLSDGSLVNIVLPPASLTGPTLTIRKFSQSPLTWEDLFRFGSCTEDVYQFIKACVDSRLNIVISGGTGSGKTTILNLTAGLISDDERIVAVEQVAEMQLEKKRLIRLESRPADRDGKGAVTMRDLVINATKMRPDRIILSEMSGSEVLNFLQAMSTGYDGSLSNIHATSVRDTLARIETMATFSDVSVPLLAVREIMAKAIDIIIHQSRIQDGSRKIIKVTEVVGRQGDNIELNDIFEFRQTGTEDGKIIGYTTATGQIPRVLDRIQAAKVDIPLSLFTPS